VLCSWSSFHVAKEFSSVIEGGLWGFLLLRYLGVIEGGILKCLLDGCGCLCADGLYVKADVDDPNWWLWLSENDTGNRDIKEVQDGLGSDGYVMVNQEDIVDSIASYIARYISSIPQAKVFFYSLSHI
jgi:hypothetical protein